MTTRRGTRAPRKRPRATAPTAAPPPASYERVVAELRVHQVELEAQNHELRHAQGELEAARARYFELYDRAPVGYCTVDAHGQILEANHVAAELLGVGQGQLAGQPLRRFIATEDRAPYDQHRRRVHDTGAPQHCELRLARPDGVTTWVRLDAVAARDPAGPPTTRVALTDVSARKLIEDENARLEAQLQQAQRMEAVGQLAGGIAHDFNNILGAIILQLDLLQMSPVLPPEVVRETATEILESANRAAALTRQLLLFSRRQAITVARLDVNQVLRDLGRLLARLIDERVEMSLQLSDEPAWIEGDIGMIEQAATNLCVNARDAMPGGGRLDISTSHVAFDDEAARQHGRARGGRFVCVRFTDTGCGIAPIDLPHIFEPFFTTKPQGQGTGLGLATVHGIVARHGGFVEVTSQVGAGSAFSLYLPSTAAGRVDAARSAPGGLRGGREAVLVVEDEAALRRAAARCLRQLGYRVHEAEHGVAALRIWEQEGGQFDLLFTDMVMPGGLSGLALCARLRRDKPGLPTIVASGYSAEIVDDEGALVGVSYLPKPYSVAALAALVRDCLAAKP